MNYLANCVLVDKAGFNVNMRSRNIRLVRDTSAIVKTLITRVSMHTILGTIATQGIISVETKKSLMQAERKRCP